MGRVRLQLLTLSVGRLFDKDRSCKLETESSGFGRWRVLMQRHFDNPCDDKILTALESSEAPK